MTVSNSSPARHRRHVWLWPLLSIACLGATACGGDSRRKASEARDLGTACGEAELVIEGTVAVDDQSTECDDVCLRGDAVAPAGTTSTGRCSCRCDGPAETGPFCQCGAGYSCEVAVRELELGDHSLAGSYCVAQP